VDLTSDDVQDILHLLDGLPFGELSLQTSRFRLSLQRAGNGQWTQALEVLGPPAASEDQAPAGGPGGRPPETAPSGGPGGRPPETAPSGGPGGRPPETAAAPDEGLTDVRAPLLGTFYRAPRPGAPPFVSVGSDVEPDTVVCIIETMKLMNSVTAGVSGTVAEIALANAQFADQGAVLMRIRERT
jgi:acetyl-CoA carboxylase biotin carboxyl carrier protein